MQIRHTSVFDQPVILEIKPIRYQCDHCGSTTTEKYDWVAQGGKITKGLEEYILRCVINSTIQDVSKRKEYHIVRLLQYEPSANFCITILGNNLWFLAISSNTFCIILL